MSEIITKTTEGFVVTVETNGKEQKGFGITEDLARERALNDGLSVRFAVVENKPAKIKIIPKTKDKTPMIRNGEIYLIISVIEEIAGFNWTDTNYRYFQRVGIEPEKIKTCISNRGAKYKIKDVMNILKTCEDQGIFIQLPQKKRFRKSIENIENYLEEQKAC